MLSKDLLVVATPEMLHSWREVKVAVLHLVERVVVVTVTAMLEVLQSQILVLVVVAAAAAELLALLDKVEQPVVT